MFFVNFYFYRDINLQNTPGRFGNKLLCQFFVCDLFTFTETSICKTSQDVTEIKETFSAFVLLARTAV